MTSYEIRFGKDEKDVMHVYEPPPPRPSLHITLPDFLGGSTIPWHGMETLHHMRDVRLTGLRGYIARVMCEAKCPVWYLAPWGCAYCRWCRVESGRHA